MDHSLGGPSGSPSGPLRGRLRARRRPASQRAHGQKPTDRPSRRAPPRDASPAVVEVTVVAIHDRSLDHLAGPAVATVRLRLARSGGPHVGLPEPAGGTGSRPFRTAAGGQTGVIAGRSGTGGTAGRLPIA